MKRVFCFLTFDFYIFNLLFILLSLATFSSLPFTLVYAQSGWGPDTQLVYMRGIGWDPRAVCWGDTIHLVWWQNAAFLGDEIFYKRSTDCGLTWGPDILLSLQNDDASVMPTVGVNGNFVHVVWKDEHAGVCYRKSNDGGDTWLPIDTLPNAGLIEPWILVDGYNLYVIAGFGTGDILFTKSTDNGNTWQPGQPVTHSCGAGRIKKLASSILLISHQDDSLGSWEIFLLKSTNDGNSWDNVYLVSEDDSWSGQRPAMDIDDSAGIHICWFDYKYSPYPWTGDIFYRAGRDSGNTWEDIDSLTIMHRAVLSDIIVEGNNLHLVWEDDRNSFDNNSEIYYRMSTDLGRTWQPEIRLTNAPKYSRCPSLACGGGYLHLFWQDARDSLVSWPIYYKRKDLSWGVSETRSNYVPFPLAIDVCPNPFTERIKVRCKINRKDGDSSEKSVVSVRMLDVSGKEVFLERKKRNRETWRHGETVIIDTKDLPCGVYFVEVRAGVESGIKKVIKVK